MSDKILTVPEEIRDYKPYFVTGNEYVSIPLIDPANGGINQINVINMSKMGLISFNGKKSPLYKPYIELESHRLNVDGNLKWTLHKNWVPEFSYEDGSIQFKGTIIAPVGVKGFMYSLRAFNKTCKPVNINIGLESSWDTSEHTVFHSRLINCLNGISLNKWTNSLVFDMKPDTTLAAIACGCTETLDTLSWHEYEHDDNDNTDVYVQNDGIHSIHALQGKSFDIEPGAEKVLDFYFGVNCEADGASTTMVDMKRHGCDNLLKATLFWLDNHSVNLDHELEAIMNKNLLFNYFYAYGNALDTEEIVPVTSRSPRYYVSAAFWSRDTFLWSYPGILLVDKQRARDILLICFKRYIRNAGIHSLYINGSVLYPGFELDELCSFIMGLKFYTEATNDFSIFDEECIIKGISHIIKVLFKNKDDEHTIFKTYLDPSDDPVKYSCLVYDNVLAYAAFEYVKSISPIYNIPGLEKYKISDILRDLKHTIYEYCTVEVNGKRIFAWSSDMNGNHEIYENPPGSLQMMSHYGFVEQNCEIFLNTLQYIYSTQNIYFSSGCAVRGIGCLHAKNPWPMEAGAAMLCGNVEEGIRFFKAVFMDNGLACETVDPDTGIASTGLAFATCAGFIGYCIFKGLNGR